MHGRQLLVERMQRLERAPIATGVHQQEAVALAHPGGAQSLNKKRREESKGEREKNANDQRMSTVLVAERLNVRVPNSSILHDAGELILSSLSLSLSSLCAAALRCVALCD